MGRDDYALAKQENSAEVKQPRKILRAKSEFENSDVKLAVFDTPTDGVVQAAARTLVDPELLNKVNGIDVVEGSPNFDSENAADTGRSMGGVDGPDKVSGPEGLRASGIELQFEEGTEQASAVSLDSRVVKQRPLEDAVQVNTEQTFKSVYVNAQKYYNRCAIMLINIPNNDQQWPRWFKVVIVLT